MKYYRRLLLILCIIIAASCGCEKKEDTEPVSSYDIETVFDDLSQKISFNDTMEIVTDDYSEMLLSISPDLYSDCILYMGSGATAEELLIFKTDSAENTEQITSALKTHLEDQKSAFEGYDPEELKILGEAYIASSKTLVFYVVSQDTDAAKPYIDAYLK